MSLYEKTNLLARTLDPTRPTHGVRVKDRGSPAEFLEDVWAMKFHNPERQTAAPALAHNRMCRHRLPGTSWDAEELLVQKIAQVCRSHGFGRREQIYSGEFGWCAFDYNSGNCTADRSVCYYGAADLYRIPKQAECF